MTLASLLLLALLLFILIWIIKRRKKGIIKAVLILLCLLLILLCIMSAFFSGYYQASDAAKSMLPDTALKLCGGMTAWLFDGPGEDAALVFYPGAKVEAAAYAPLLQKIADGGVDAFLVEMPLHFALIGTDAAERLMSAWAYDNWILAGHSLGGVAASSFAAAHPESVGGLVMLASYPTKKLDKLPYLSIYGDSDHVLNTESYEKSRALWPENAEELVIPGGNHAQFADYGPQRGDGEASISAGEQQTMTTESILSWVHTHITEGMKAA